MGKKIVLFFWFLLALLLISSCSDEEIPIETTSDDGNSTAVTTPWTPPSLDYNDTLVNVSYVTATNLSDAGVTVYSASVVSGTLLTISDELSFRCNTSSLVAPSEISSSVSHVKEHNLIRLYGNKSKNYLLASSQIFLKEDAFQPWEDLMRSFVEDTGKTSVQVVSAYVYDGDESLFSSFVTGYSLAINLYEDGSNYSLASSEKKVSVNGKTMTCLDWFQDHCVKYGFVYTGLAGDHTKTVATFRYVGVPHALAMQGFDYVDTQEYTKYLRDSAQIHTVTDFENDITWCVVFCPADKNEDTTQIALPKGSVYTVSGDNVDGFIVAYYMPES